MKNRVFLFCSLLLVLPAVCSAQHGKDSLLTATSSTPHPGQWFGLRAMKILTMTATLLTLFAGALLAQSGTGTSGQLVKLQVSGMHCKSCVQSIEKSVRRVFGVDSVFVDMRAGFVEVRCDSPSVRTESITHMIHRAGFRVKGLIQ